jgi:uncharacterized membrane protein
MTMELQQARRSYGQSNGQGADRQSLDPARSNGGQQNTGTAGGEERLAKALGWFSLGLGLAQIAAPESVARWIGVREDDDNIAMLRTVGLREIASGFGILTRPRPTGWLWSRVAGDVMDLALLSSALNASGVEKERVSAATAAVVGITALDLLASERVSRISGASGGGNTMAGGIAPGVHPVTRSLTVNRPADELYRFWRNYSNLPQFMHFIESVEMRDNRQSHWRAKGPAGTTAEWNAETVEDRPNELIAWRSLAGSQVQTSGVVRFQPAPAGQGAVVRVEMQFTPPGGPAGAAFAKLFGGAFDQMVLEDLRRFKQLMETGEIPRAEAQLWGSREGPAQFPPESVPA